MAMFGYGLTKFGDTVLDHIQPLHHDGRETDQAAVDEAVIQDISIFAGCGHLGG
jgi:hypothetical protein